MALPSANSLVFKLIPAKGQAPTVIVDHIELPTDN